MPNDAILNVGLNLSPAEAQINQFFARAERKLSGVGGSIGKGFSLGKISGDFKEFDKSLDSSNARVLAFGASAGIILGVQRAFSQLIKETINVEKALTDINVIMNLSTKNLTNFGAKLFDIAKNTGQSFGVVAEAATELSRQGLNATETLRRTNDALILSRQSGLDAADSVKAITAALNSFTKEALTSTSVINKLANVDAQFAVSSADLANAIARVGSTAQDAGTDINELIGLVTAAQQITSRGGAVIGNALKSIFTRISRPEVIEQLQELGVQINETQSGLEKLRNLSSALSQASPAQASIIKELAGGVFQVNQLSAVLTDLNSKYSITTRATREASNATDEAIQRNEKLNKTYATLVNTTLTNLQQVGSQFGKISFGPAIERVLSVINSVLEGAVSKNSESTGELLGKGILKGLGEFIGGPGLILVGGAIIKLVGRLANEAGTAFKTITGLNDAARQRAQLEQNISGILVRQPDLIKKAQTGYLGILEAVKLINLELARQEQYAGVAANLVGKAVASRAVKGKIAAVGLIPEVQERLGALEGGYAPGEVREINVPKYGKVVYNTAETIKTFPDMEQPAILPPKRSKAGKKYQKDFQDKHGFDPYKAEGLVPNYANKFYRGVTAGMPLDFKYGGIFASSDPSISKQYMVERHDEENQFYPSSKMGVFSLNKKLKALDLSRQNGYDTFLKLIGQNLGTDSNEYRQTLDQFHKNKKLLYPVLENKSVQGLLKQNNYDFIQLNEFDRNDGIDYVGKSILVLNKEALANKKTFTGEYANKAFSLGLIPNYAKFQPRIELGELLGRGSYKDIFSIKSIQQDLFGNSNFDPKEVVAGILRNANIKDFEKQEQLFKLGAPVPKIFGYQEVLAPTRLTNNLKRKTAALIEKVEPFSADRDLRYLGETLGQNKFDIGRNVAKILTQYLKDKEYISSYRKSFGSFNGDLVLRNLGVKQGFSRGQALDELATISQINLDKTLGAGDIRYIDSIFRNSGLSIVDSGYLNPKNKGLIPNYSFKYPSYQSFKKSQQNLNLEEILHGQTFKFAQQKYLNVDLNKINIPINYKGKNNFSVDNLLNKGDFILNHGLIPNYADLPNINLSSPYIKMTHFSENLKKLREIPDIFSKTDYIRELDRAGIIKYLGRGSSRHAFDIGDDYVLKLARTNPEGDDNRLEKGMAQNRIEANPLLKNYRDILPSVYEAAPDYSYLISERVDPFNRNIFKKATNLDDPGYLNLYAKYGKVGETDTQFTKKFTELYRNKTLNLVPDLSHGNFGTGLRNGRLSPLILDVGLDRDIAQRLYNFFPTANVPTVKNIGLIPNFSPITDAIKREAKAGVALSQIKIGSDTRLTSKANPAGLGVYNLRDEPRGLQQGIHRALSQGLNPKTYGGQTPNFANYYANIPSAFKDPFDRPEASALVPPQTAKEIDAAVNLFKKQIQAGTRTIEEIANKSADLGKEFGLTTKTVSEIRGRFFKSLKFFQQSQPIPSGKTPASSLFPAEQGGLFGVAYGNQLPIAPTKQQSELNRSLRQQALADALLKNQLRISKISGLSQYSNIKSVTPYSNVSREEILRNLQTLNPTSTPPYVQPRPPETLYGPSADKFLYARAIQRIKEQEKENLQNIEIRKQQIESKNIVYQNTSKSRLRKSITPLTQEEIEASKFSTTTNPDLIGIQSPRLQELLRQSRENRSISPVYVNRFQRFKNKITNFAESPTVKNNALLASFVLPTIAGPLAESIGDKSIGARGASQSVTSLANVASYGALGLSFGAVGGIAGIVGGLALELPRVVKAFSDNTPDLERAIEKLSENLNRANDGFSSIIQVNEKLAQYQRGELNLNPFQYGALKQGRNEQISQLSISFPQYAKDIRKAANSGNNQEIEKLNSTISFEIQKQELSDRIGLIKNKIDNRSFFQQTDPKDIENYNKLILTQRSQNKNNELDVRGFILENAKTNSESNYLSNFEKAFRNIDIINKDSELIKKGTTTQIKSAGNVAFEETTITPESQIRLNRREALARGAKNQLIETLSKLQSQGGYEEFSQYIDTLKNTQANSPDFLKIAADLSKRINTPEIRDALSQPPQTLPNFSKDQANLFKSFNDLKQQLDTFVTNLEIINNSKLAKIQRDLDLNIAKTQGDTEIGVFRNQPYSPFTALQIQKAGQSREIELKKNAEIEGLTTTFNTFQKTAPAQLTSQIQDIILKRVESGKGGYETLFPLYNESFKKNINNILPERTFAGPLSVLPGKFAPKGNAFESVADRIKNLNPIEQDQFYKNLEKEKSRLYKEASSGASQENQQVLLDLAKLYGNLLTNRTTEIEKFNSQVKQANEAAKSAQQKLEIETNVQKESIIESLTSSYATIVGNIDKLRENAEKAYNEVQSGGLTGRSAIRRINFINDQSALNEARKDYRNNEIDTQQYRGVLNQSANSELEETGKLKGSTLGELFTSNFKYNKRDFFGQIKDDTLEIGATMRAEFHSAFESFVDGSKSASDAARQLGISIATNILTKTADIGLNSLIGGLSSLGSSIFSSFGSRGTTPVVKAHGGPIGFAGGGIVRGGSGIRDDIAASLPKGSFVIQKSAVNKYGAGLLNKLNHGGPLQFADGGPVNVKLQNTFDILGRKEKTTGAFNISPKLSVIGQTDENNPANALKFANEQDFYNYQKTIQQYKAQVAEFENAKNQRVYGAAISAVIGVAGQALSSAFAPTPLTSEQQTAFEAGQGPVSAQYAHEYAQTNASYFNNASTNFSQSSPYSISSFFARNRGGLMGFANGGDVKDNIPALLTGGEYVMNRDTVSKYGVPFMRDLNAGMIPNNISRFANGGLVGGNINSVNPVIQDSSSGDGWKQIISAIDKQTKALETLLNKNTNKTNGKTGDSGSQPSVTNQVTIQINMQEGKATQGSSKTESNGSSADKENVKKLAEMMQSVALKTIIDQQRDGGLLGNTRTK